HVTGVQTCALPIFRVGIQFLFQGTIFARPDLPRYRSLPLHSPMERPMLRPRSIKGLISTCLLRGCRFSSIVIITSLKRLQNSGLPAECGLKSHESLAPET